MSVAKHFIDLTGQRFGMLTVLRRAPKRPGSRVVYWECVCDCGTECAPASQAIRLGRTKSCGCQMGKRPGTKGYSFLEEYNIYRGIISRCENPNRKCFSNYGGRGITVCAEWRGSFEAFFAHVGPRPSARHSIERIDNERGYEPGNVRWALPAEQAVNKRRTRFVKYRGRTLPLTVAVREAGSVIHWEAAWIRITRCGWSPEEAIETPRLHESGPTVAKFRRGGQ